jgi:hypothetical protein
VAKFNWRKLVGTVAPGLATVLGGPLAGMAVKAISTGLLGKPDAGEADIEAALATATPADLLKLKEIEQTFILDMRKLDIDVFALEVDDRKSARSLYAVNYWPQITLSGLFIGGYFTILGLYITGKVVIPADVKDTVTVLIGIMSASVTATMAFWFGSSFGSREKTAALAASKPAEGGV